VWEEAVVLELRHAEQRRKNDHDVNPGHSHFWRPPFYILLCILHAQAGIMVSAGPVHQRHGTSIRDCTSFALISLLRWMMNSSIRDLSSGPEKF
jgi:hypothetical protein